MDLDRASKSQVYAVSTGISMMYDRALAGQIASDTTGAMAQTQRSSSMVGLVAYGGFEYGNQGGAGGGTRNGRGADAIDNGIASRFSKYVSSSR